ncbi:MAG: hypothetical protein AAF495_06260 [Pseudomonadota bacterium]
MNGVAKVRQVICKHLHDPRSSFSIGSFGAIAEFHRDPDEALILDDDERLAIATSRGALRVSLSDEVVPLAYEMLSRRRDRWQHGVVFCLPTAVAASRAHTSVTELGPDSEAIRPKDRKSILFDMGLRARNIDFCIRTKDPALISALRDSEGKSIFAPDSAAMKAIINASPHRIAVSKLGRLEVYQAIGKVKTPEGPHTHVLPQFLKGGRTHSANIPVPRGHMPCLSLYPPNPLVDGLGRETPFDSSALLSFQSILDLWGAPEFCAEKARVTKAVLESGDPSSYDAPASRIGRTGLRIALRQLNQTDGDNPIVQEWRLSFDGRGRRSRRT